MFNKLINNKIESGEFENTGWLPTWQKPRESPVARPPGSAAASGRNV